MEIIHLEELSSVVEDIHLKTREASQNTNLDMRVFLGIEKALLGIRGEFLNNMSKLTEIDKRIKRHTKELKEVEKYPTYSDEQRQLYRDRLDDLNIEKQNKVRNTIKKMERIFRSKSQESSKPFKKFLIKIRLC